MEQDASLQEFPLINESKESSGEELVQAKDSSESDEDDQVQDVVNNPVPSKEIEESEKNSKNAETQSNAIKEREISVEDKSKDDVERQWEVKLISPRMQRQLIVL